MSSTSVADRAAAAWLDARDVPGTILTALDGSPFSESALAHAAGFARALGCGLHLVTVLDPLRTGATSRTSVEARLQRLEALDALDRVSKSLRSRGHECTYEVREGQPAVELLGAAIERGIDLIALAARPRPERECLTTGSVLHGIVASGLPSLLVARGGRARLAARGGREATYRRIAVVVDGRGGGHRALRLATRLARPHGAELVLVQVRGAGDLPDDGRHLHVLEQTVSGAGVPARRRVFRSWSEAEAAHGEADLLVIPAGGLGDRAPGYGADARRLLLQAEIPVLALREPAGPPATLAPRPARPSERRSFRRRAKWSRSGPEGVR